MRPLSGEFHHEAVVFGCAGEELIGVIEHPEVSLDIGIVVVTGGPQYRIGSHRQFVHIARALATQGFPVMRYDYRGMGDSGGDQIEFFESGPDLTAAIDQFVRSTGVRRIALWGLCDGASVCLCFGARHEMVETMILLNPWIRSESGLARTYVRHYYLSRLFSASFWSKLLTGKLRFGQSTRELSGNLRKAFGANKDDASTGAQTSIAGRPADFRELMYQGLKSFRGSILTLLCENDLTAKEYADFVERSARWRKMIGKRRVTQKVLVGMDHTFSREIWRNEIIVHTKQWITDQRLDRQ